MTEQRRSNPALEFLKGYWFLILFSFSGIGVMANLYFEVTYMAKALNPDTMIEYNKEQAILSTKREIRWCLGKMALNGPVNKPAMLNCAD
jgi:hypothetical protein